MINKKIKILSDNYINSYLESRNLLFNRSKMINSKNISRLEHYIWWLTNKREMFLFTPEKNILIFFWQEIISYNKKKYLVGGWHSNRIKINLYYIIAILKWQLRRNKNKKVNYPWLAVVKNNNKSVLKLTNYLGYKIISRKNNYLFNVIKSIFSVSNKKYYFLYLKNN
jgi:hypothetical protein